MRAEAVAVRTERSQLHTKTTEVQYSTVRLEQARLVSSLLCDARTKLFNFVFADFREQKYAMYDRFLGTVRMDISRPELRTLAKSTEFTER